ncbi:MAG: hypothetical protein C4534_02745 [Gaiellales bacterium]|nr:MAG: hypothetical protein C4534_02745 [Gaiellales bacterium]
MERILRLLASVAMALMACACMPACGDGAAGPDDYSAGPAVAPAEGEAGQPWSIHGFNFTAWWHDDFLGPEAMAALDGIAAAGAGWVAVVPTWYMEDPGASGIAPEFRGRSATEASVARAVDEAHARGLKVMLKPHVDVKDGSWRGEIEPEDPEAWFDSYREMLAVYALLARRHGVEMLCVGNELDSMAGPSHNSQWALTIAATRMRYRGPLAYGASIDSYRDITFWPLLDYMGLSFYYPLSDAAQPTREELVRGWTGYSGYYDEGADWLDRIEQWQGHWQKSVIFTEIGYRSVDHAARSPWDYGSEGPYNGAAQANAYQAAFDVLADRPWLAGIFWWNWSARADACGSGNTDYTICGKPAEEVVRRASGKSPCPPGCGPAGFAWSYPGAVNAGQEP